MNAKENTIRIQCELLSMAPLTNARRSLAPGKTGLMPVRPYVQNPTSSFKSPQGKTPIKTGITPKRPDKSPGAALRRRTTGLVPIRPESGRSPAQEAKFRSGLLPIRNNENFNGRGALSTSCNFTAGKSPGSKFKSGLTPMRPTKSPGLALSSSFAGDAPRFKCGMQPIRPGEQPNQSTSCSFTTGTKFKTGLTPMRPAKSPGQSLSSSLANNVSRYKCGLQPIRPGLSQNLNAAETSVNMFANRRRSGILPIRPNLMRRDDCDDHQQPPPPSFLLKTTVFSASNPPGVRSIRTSMSSDGSSQKSMSGNSVRREIIPSRRSIGVVAGGSLSASQRQVNDVTLQVPTFRHTDSGGPSVDGDRSQQVDPKSLNTISEEAESPATFKDHNLSDIQPLDETADTSFRLRSQSKRKSSIAARNISGGGQPTDLEQRRISRIPVGLPAVRTLVFPEDDEEADDDENDDFDLIESKILLDATMKLNSLSLQPTTSSKNQGHSVTPPERNLPIATTVADSENTPPPRLQDLPLLRKKRAQLLEQVNRLDLIIERLEAEEQAQGTDLDSPFANIDDSPVMAEPTALLAPNEMKRPEDIYKIARKSCSFLKTPKPSAFRREKSATSDFGGVDDTPNIGSRLAQQLASLYDS